MTGQSYDPDMTDAKIVRDARTELNDAIDRGDQRAMAAWARTYGAAAMEDWEDRCREEDLETKLSDELAKARAHA